MSGYLTAVVLGAALGLGILVSNHGGISADGWSARDIAGGAVEVGFYPIAFVVGLAIKRRVSN